MEPLTKLIRSLTFGIKLAIISNDMPTIYNTTIYNNERSSSYIPCAYDAEKRIARFQLAGFSREEIEVKSFYSFGDERWWFSIKANNKEFGERRAQFPYDAILYDKIEASYKNGLLSVYFGSTRSLENKIPIS